MKIIEDLKVYGVTPYLDGEELKIKGLNEVSPQDRQVVSRLIKQAQGDKESLVYELKGSPIKRSGQARVQVNKAFISGEPIEHIAEILIRCVADLTGDKAFEIQNLRALNERNKANG